jgi:hypothetical protein
MAFEWQRIHKHEDAVENDIFERVKEAVGNYYEVENIENLTQEQINEIEKWQEEELPDGSIMNIGFDDVINYWESHQTREPVNDNEEFNNNDSGC